jgi:prepilin-type N-terminal cleavage/methylation domain-containing protein
VSFPHVHREEGFSLAELLVTIVIVGVTFTALLGGLMTSTSVSSLHRKQATADAVARSAAEWIKDSVANPYVNCATTYSTAGLPVPSGYSVAITQVQYWTGATPVAGTAYSPTFSASCPSPDKGLQQIAIVVTSSDSQVTQTVQVLKRVVS